MESTREETVAKLTRNMSPDHPLVQQARALLTDPYAPIADERPVLNALLTRLPFKARERNLASWLIARVHWTDDQRAAITKSLSNALDRAVRGGGPGHTITWGVTLAAIPVVYYMAPAFFREPSIWLLMGAMLYLIMGGLVTLPVAVLVHSQLLRRMRPVVEALTEAGGPDGIIALARATSNSTLAQTAGTALKRMTERLRPEDALSDAAMSALCRILRSFITPLPIVCMLLEALAVLGDERAIPTVTKLAQSAKTPDVREAAAGVLPCMEQRALRRKDAAQLVRASAEPIAAGDTLLRVAHDPSAADPAQLLRVSMPPEET